MDHRLFVDSDVVISSLISNSGAAYFLLNQSPVKPVITSVSLKELKIVISRMRLKESKLITLVKKRLEVIYLSDELKKIKKDYDKYVTDKNDAHIIAGAQKAKVKFLISYNLRHFKSDKIKDELDILVMTPALFMQYLRSN